MFPHVLSMWFSCSVGELSWITPPGAQNRCKKTHVKSRAAKPKMLNTSWHRKKWTEHEHSPHFANDATGLNGDGTDFRCHLAALQCSEWRFCQQVCVLLTWITAAPPARSSTIIYLCRQDAHNMLLPPMQNIENIGSLQQKAKTTLGPQVQTLLGFNF